MANWLSSFLHPEKGYEKGQNQLDKYFQMAQEFQQPFVNNSKETYGGLSQALQKLLNPQALEDEWSNGYQESQYGKDLEEDATQHGLNAASSLGLNGSSPALAAIQRGTSRIGAEDKRRYLNDLMQKYMQGIGLGENIYGAGINSANNLSNNAVNMGNNSAQMSYNKEKAPGNLFGGLLGLGSSLLPLAGSLLGPLGSIGGSLLGGLFGKKSGGNNNSAEGGSTSNQWNLTGG